jgi:hypothetical protein
VMKRALLVCFLFVAGCAGLSQSSTPFDTSLMVEDSNTIQTKITELDYRVIDLEQRRRKTSEAAASPERDAQLAPLDAELTRLAARRKSLISRKLELMTISPNM